MALKIKAIGIIAFFALAIFSLTEGVILEKTVSSESTGLGKISALEPSDPL